MAARAVDSQRRDSRSFAERLIHAAAANYYFTNLAVGQKPPGEEDPPRAQFRNKAAMVAYVKKSFADGVAIGESVDQLKDRLDNEADHRIW